MARLSAVLAVLLFLISATLSAAPARPAAHTVARPNIILIVLDTLRYDATQNGNMPFLASLGDRSVVFTNAYSTHDFTPTSHFSIFTGLRDGLGTDDDRVENGLAYQLGRAGYHTVATVANNILGQKEMPTVRGFKDFKQLGDISTGTFFDSVGDLTAIDFRLRLFRCDPKQRNRVKTYFTAEQLLPPFLEQIENTKPPFFGFVNLLDVHEPYIPDPRIYPPERALPPNFDGDVLYRRLPPELTNPDAIPDPKRREFVKAKIAQAGGAWLTSLDLSPQALAVYHARYNALARGADATLREFYAALEAKGLLDNTVVVITSDHGESFGEDDLITHMFHDRGDYESTHHVPMIVVLPPSMHAKAKVVDRRVSIRNLAPTIYDFAGLNWTAFKTRYPTYALSLLPMLTDAPPQYAAAVLLPKPSKQDHSEAEREREKTLRSLGYIH